VENAAKVPSSVLLLRLRCLAALGRTEEARALGNRALAETTDPRDASELKQLLETLPTVVR
jgi:hypothetical protein